MTAGPADVLDVHARLASEVNYRATGGYDDVTSARALKYAGELDAVLTSLHLHRELRP